MTKRAQQNIARKLNVLRYAQEKGNVAKLAAIQDVIHPRETSKK